MNAVIKRDQSLLPANPSKLPTTQLADACQHIFEQRDELVGYLDVASAMEALQRAGAIERYVRTRDHKDTARRAARVLETAVGAALPDADGEKGGRGKKGVRVATGLSTQEATGFRLMAKHRAAWWPQLAEKALSRKRVLDLIDRFRRLRSRPEIDDSLTDQVVLGDFRETCADLRSESVSLIFTDPPYDRKSLPLYRAAADQAARVLRPGGSLIMYCGQYLVPDILSACAQSGMRYWWMLACVHDGGQLARMREYGIVVNWKPMLWFVKGTRGDKETFLHDLVMTPQEKDTHDWQQSILEAEYFIEKLTARRELVVDFFCGAGSTLIAADRLGRHWRAYELDPETRNAAIQRIASDRASRQSVGAV